MRTTDGDVCEIETGDEGEGGWERRGDGKREEMDIEMRRERMRERGERNVRGGRERGKEGQG